MNDHFILHEEYAVISQGARHVFSLWRRLLAIDLQWPSERNALEPVIRAAISSVTIVNARVDAGLSVNTQDLIHVKDGVQL